MKRLAQSKLVTLLLFGETRLLRFWLALCSFGYAAWVAFDPDYATGHAEAVSLASVNMQVALFILHGLSVMYGVVTGRFNTVLLMTEGLLGVFLWFGLGMAETTHQGTPGPMLIAGLIAIFLLVRYPTHYGVPDAN